MIREPMTPAEFDAECRAFETANPELSLTSGKRSRERNRQVGGSDASKHLLGMARDYSAPSLEIRDQAIEDAVRRGFWLKPYAWGLHVQGLPQGEVPHWWRDKYVRETT